VRIDHRPVLHVLEHLDLGKGLLELKFVFGLDGFADQTQGVTVGDGAVVIVFVDVVAEEDLGVEGLPFRGFSVFVSRACEGIGNIR